MVFLHKQLYSFRVVWVWASICAVSNFSRFSEHISCVCHLLLKFLNRMLLLSSLDERVEGALRKIFLNFPRLNESGNRLARLEHGFGFLLGWLLWGFTLWSWFWRTFSKLPFELLVNKPSLSIDSSLNAIYWAVHSTGVLRRIKLRVPFLPISTWDFGHSLTLARLRIDCYIQLTHEYL